MSAPRLLDLFAGAGGCSVGYHRAGFEVIGVDIEPHPDYPFEFVQADATTYPLDSFDALAGSPPCSDHSTLSKLYGYVEHGTGWMLQHTINRFEASGLPFIVENVSGAKMGARHAHVVLCGSMFGLGAHCRDGQFRQLRRHRRFLSNVLLMPPGRCQHHGQPIGVYGQGAGNRISATRPDGYPSQYRGPKSEASEALGIDWMSNEDLSQAIPPAYTQWLGAQLLDHLVVVT